MAEAPFDFDARTAFDPPVVRVVRKIAAKVAKKLSNQLNTQRPEGLYLFVRDIEGGGQYPALVHLEWTDKRWMDSVWDELRALRGGDQLDQVWQGRNWDENIGKIMQTHAEYFSRVFRWYLGRAGDAGKGVMVAGLLKLQLPAGNEARSLFRPRYWYFTPPPVFDEPAAEPDGPSPWLAGDYTTIGLTYLEWCNARPAWILAPVLLPEQTEDGSITQGAMQTLHFVHAAPLESEDGQGPDSDGTPEESGSGSAAAARDDDGPEAKSQARWMTSLDALLGRHSGPPTGRRRSAFSFVRKLIRAAAELLWPAPLPKLAFAGGGSIHAYVGYPAGGIVMPAPGGPLLQLANPMVGGGVNPYVAVLDVGEANCNVLYDNTGKARVYFDLGLPTAAHTSTRPNPIPSPCFCDDPLVILSHWDEDHYVMGNHYAESRALRWIVPQQACGGGPIVLLGNIINDGGQVLVWTAASPSHMRFAWGWVERSDGSPNDTNISGLNAYVCLTDAGGNAVLGWTAAAALWPAAPGAHLAGLGTVNAGAAAPPHRAAAAAAAAAVPNHTAARDGIAKAVALSPAARGAGLPNNATIGRMAEVAERAAAGGGNAQAVTIAVASCLHLVPGNTLAVIAAAAIAAPPLVPGPATNDAGARAAVAGGTHLATAGNDQHMAEITVGVIRHAAGVTNLDYAQAAIAGAGTNPIAVAAVVIEAAVTAALAAQAAAAGSEEVAAIHAAGGVPALGTIRGAAPLVLNGSGPFHADERYVLLTGDALYRFLPPQQLNPAPVVVALNAVHHGSKQDAPLWLSALEVPWAPASNEARCAATAASAFAAGIPAAASAVAAAVALALDTPRPALNLVAAAAIEAARLNGTLQAVAIAAASAKRCFALGVTPQQTAAGAVAAHQFIVAQQPNAVNAAAIAGDGGFQGSMPVAGHPEVSAVAAAVGMAVMPGLAGMAAGASHAGGGDTNLVAAVVTATQRVRVVATVAGSMVNPLVLALYPGTPVDWDQGTHLAATTEALRAAQAAAAYLAPNITSDNRLVCTAAAAVANANVVGRGISSIVTAQACAAALAAHAHGLNARAVAVATSNIFAIAANSGATAVRLIEEENVNNIVVHTAKRTRHVLQHLAAAANVAVGAVPAGGADALARQTVAAHANVAGALRAIVDPAVFTLPVRVALESLLANATANESLAAMAYAVRYPGSAVPPDVLVTTARNAFVPGVHMLGRPAQINADAPGLVGGTVTLPIAQAIVGIVYDIRNAAGPVQQAAVESLSATVAGRTALQGKLQACVAVRTDLHSARGLLAHAAVQAVRHSAGATAQQVSVVVDDQTISPLSGLDAALIEWTLTTAHATGGAAANTVTQIRTAADTAGVNRAIIMAATWGSGLAIGGAQLPIVEAAASESLGYMPGPVVEGLAAAMDGRYPATAEAAADVAAGTTASRVISYSYGVKWNGAAPPFRHCYPSNPFETGPPDPSAIAIYESHGWTERRNTCTRAHQAVQPGIAGGHVALGWETAGGGAPYAGPLRNNPGLPACTHCRGAANPTNFII